MRAYAALLLFAHLSCAAEPTGIAPRYFPPYGNPRGPYPFDVPSSTPQYTAPLPRIIFHAPPEKSDVKLAEDVVRGIAVDSVLIPLKSIGGAGEAGFWTFKVLTGEVGVMDILGWGVNISMGVGAFFAASAPSTITNEYSYFGITPGGAYPPPLWSKNTLVLPNSLLNPPTQVQNIWDETEMDRRDQEFIDRYERWQRTAGAGQQHVDNHKTAALGQ